MVVFICKNTVSFFSSCGVYVLALHTRQSLFFSQKIPFYYSQKQQQAGFSLLECLVAQSLLLILMASMHQLLVSGAVYFSEIQQTTRMQWLLFDLEQRILLVSNNKNVNAKLDFHSLNARLVECESDCQHWQILYAQIKEWQRHALTVSAGIAWSVEPSTSDGVSSYLLNVTWPVNASERKSISRLMVF